MDFRIFFCAALLTGCILLLPGCGGGSQPGEVRSFPADLSLKLPRRNSSAPGGTSFIRSVDTAEFEEREKRITEEILSGNIPDFLRTFRRFTYTVSVPPENGNPGGGFHTVEFYALPDYLAVGPDSNFVRMPMGPLAAQQIADSLFCSLPTAFLVDRIALAAEGAIEPFPFRPLGNRNEQPVVFEDSNHAIEALFKAKGYEPGRLISGLKKDVIISARITDSARLNHVTIYGWHRPDGSRIQPSSNVHTNDYVDYSHGIRLVYRIIKIDGGEYDIQQVLKDPRLFRLVSDEPVPMVKPTYAGDALHSRTGR